MSRTAISEFRRDGAWRIVATALVGMAFGLSALPFYTLGVFAKPLVTEFGWSRSTVQSGLTAAMLGIVASAWLAGWLVDRFGARPVVLVSQVGLALGFCGLALQTGDPHLWQLNWFLFAVAGVGTTPLSWSRCVASWFDRQRGLALGIALGGTGLTAFIAPPLLTAVIAAHGWRAGYLSIAAAIVVVAVPMVLLFFRERSTAVATGAGAIAEGMTLGEALRTRAFWLIAIAFVAVAGATAGVITNLVPLLTDGGLDAATAARYASLLGLNVIAGRLVAGWLLDRLWAPVVGALLLVPPAIACVLLAVHQAPGLAVALVGLAAGAEFDLIAYLCLRCFGIRHFGQIYAWQWASFSLAAGAGPLAFGLMFDSAGHYSGALYAAAALLLLGPSLLFALGRYPRGSPRLPSDSLLREVETS